MADFSHLPSLIYRPALVAKMVERKEVVTDETLLEIYRRIDPPLLDNNQSDVVEAILCNRRGRRPKRGVPSTNWLARQVGKIERNDDHPVYVAALSERIRSGKSETDLGRARRCFREARRRDRDMFIRTIFRDLRAALVSRPERVTLEHFGEIEVPVGMPQQMQAATMTLQVLSEKLGLDRISHARIIRIAAMR